MPKDIIKQNLHMLAFLHALKRFVIKYKFTHDRPLIFPIYLTFLERDCQLSKKKVSQKTGLPIKWNIISLKIDLRMIAL